MDQVKEGYIQSNQSDTIDLRELIAILKKRKKLIYAVTALITIFSVVYAFFIAKPIYAVKFAIETGQIEGKPIEEVNTFREKLTYLYKVGTKSAERKLPLVKTIIAKKDSPILSFTVLGKNNDEALKYAQTVISQTEALHKEQTDSYRDNRQALIELTQNDIAQINTSITTLTHEITDYREKISSLKNEDASLTGVYVLRIGQLQTELQALKEHLSNLKTKKQTLELSITPVKMKPTHSIGEIETLAKPIEPKEKLIVAVNFISGLILSLFLALLVEFIATMRSKEDKASFGN